LAPEGRPFVAGGVAILGAVAAVSALAGGWWWLLLGIWLPLSLWIPFFFRDPERSGPRGDHLALAPADGRIISVDSLEEPEYLKGSAQRVSIFMNVFDVHVNRHPLDGQVEYADYRPGRFFNASLDKASQHNERSTLGVRTAHGRMLVRQIAGLVARRIVTDAQLDTTVRQGERLGLIRFGSRVELYLPTGWRVRVSKGDRAYAGVTVIAEHDS
jgi:phosphatidylserine decarboxylase